MNRHERRARKATDVAFGGGKLEARYGSRTIKLEVLVNTDEDLQTVATRVSQAVGGPGRRMAVVQGDVLEPEDGVRTWAKWLPQLQEQLARRGQA